VHEVAALDTLALSLSQHPRAYFVVVLPALTEQEVWATLSGARSVAPSGLRVCLIAPADVTPHLCV